MFREAHSVPSNAASSGEAAGPEGRSLSGTGGSDGGAVIE